MRILVLTLFILLMSCSHRPHKYKSRLTSSEDSASTSTFTKTSCLKLVNSIVGKSKQKLIDPIVGKMSQWTLESKLSFLKKIKSQSGRLKFQTQAYANTLNQLLERDLISMKEVKSLIKYDRPQNYLLEVEGGKIVVIPRHWPGLPNLEETLAIISNEVSPSGIKKQKLRELLEEAEFNPEELEIFRESFKSYPTTNKEWEILQEYFLYVSSLRTGPRKKALGDVGDLFSQSHDSKDLKTFFKLRKDIEKYEKEQFTKIKNKEIQKGSSNFKAKLKAKKDSRRLTQTYSGLKYACRSAKPTEESKVAINATKNLFMGLGLGVTVGTYAYSNWDKDKTHWEWYGKLGHDIGWKIFFQYGYNAIMTDQGASLLKKMLSLHIFYTPMDAVEAAMYDLEFGEENTFINEEYERLIKLRKENNTEFIKEYNEAMSSLNHKYFPEKFREFTRALLNGEIKIPESSKQEFEEILTLEDITSDELEEEELKERLIMAINQQLYNEGSGGVKTGSAFLDRYLFVRSFDVVDVPVSLLTGLWIYRTLCMGGANSKAALAKATLIYTVYTVVNKFIYYELRRDAINM